MSDSICQIENKVQTSAQKIHIKRSHSTSKNISTSPIELRKPKIPGTPPQQSPKRFLNRKLADEIDRKFSHGNIDYSKNSN